MTKPAGIPSITVLARGATRRNVVNTADYRTRGALPPSKAERDRVRALLENRARLV